MAETDGELYTIGFCRAKSPTLLITHYSLSLTGHHSPFHIPRLSEAIYKEVHMEKSKTAKRIRANVIVIFLLVICLCLNTFTFFNTEIIVESNIFGTENDSVKSNSEKINLNDGNPVITENEFLFEPGMTVTKDFFIENLHSGDLFYKLYFEDVSGGLEDILEISIKDGDSVLYSGTASTLTADNVSPVPEALPKKTKKTLTINFHYPETAGNDTQGLTLSFVLCAEVTGEDVVKLMPVEGNETVMIERGNGAVETYCTDSINGFAKATTIVQKKKFAPVGVKSVTKAFDETYGDYTFNSEDYSTWYVYGLTTNLSKTSIKNYLTVSGDGYFEVTLRKGTSRVGTGAVITVYDKEGTVVEKFYVVIFGDVDQNGSITAGDITTVSRESANKTKWSKAGTAYTPYLVRAANIDGNNTTINAGDISMINKVNAKKLTLNQTTGRAS